MTECEICGGRGWVELSYCPWSSDEYEPCPECGGTGWEPLYPEDFQDDEAYDRAREEEEEHERTDR